MTVTIQMQLPAGLTKEQALAQALRYKSVVQWKADGGSGFTYDPVTGLAVFPQ